MQPEHPAFAEAIPKLLEEASEALVAVDDTATIVFVNGALEKLFGYERDALLGEPIELLVPDELRAAHLAHRTAYLAAPESRPMGSRDDLFGRHRDGRKLPVRIGLSSARVAGKTYVLAVVIDVSELHKALEALSDRAQQLERSNRDLEEFAYVASHDLQEPLRKVQAFGERIMTRCSDALDDRGKDYLERMMKSARRMSVLINDLLTFSRVTSRPRAPQFVDLGEATREVLSDLSDLLERLGGRVEVGELPRVRAEESQMRQLLQNLIGNGLKFHRDGVPPVVQVRATRHGDRWRITVADNGIGIDEKYFRRIFTVFQRLHGRDAYEGTGIGLALCRKIAQRHGGDITVESELGVGTTFVVDLPAAKEDA